MIKTKSSIWSSLRDAFDRFAHDDGFTVAGNIAFCQILAIFPFLIFVFSLVGFFGTPMLAQQVMDTLLAIAPTEIVEPLRAEIEALFSENRPGLLTVSGLVLLWTSSRGIQSLRDGLNSAYRLQEGRAIWWRIVQDILFVIIGAVVLIALLLLLVFAPAILKFTSYYLPGLKDLGFGFEFLRYSIGLILLFVALTASHLFLPARRFPIKRILPGVFITMVIWLIVAVAYSIYLSNFAYYASLYAGLGGLFAALIFLYISGAIFQFGGEINRAVFVRDYGNKDMGVEDD